MDVNQLPCGTAGLVFDSKRAPGIVLLGHQPWIGFVGGPVLDAEPDRHGGINEYAQHGAMMALQLDV